MKFYDMACVDCGAKLLATTNSRARKQGWLTWTGGARCGTCSGKSLAVESAPVAHSHTVKLVACSACQREFAAEQEYVDGYRPGMHWVKPSIEQVASIRGRALRLPLCPGWNRAGVLLGEVAA